MFKLHRFSIPGALVTLGCLLLSSPQAFADHEYRIIEIQHAAAALADASEHLHDVVDGYGHSGDVDEAADRLDDSASDLRDEAGDADNLPRIFREFDRVESHFRELSFYFRQDHDDHHVPGFQHDFESVHRAYNNLRSQMVRLESDGLGYRHDDERGYRRHGDQYRYRR